MNWEVSVIGLFVGILIGFTSMGGGALLTPALVLIVGIPPSVAVANDLFIATVTKFFGAAKYAVHREVNWGVVFRLALGSIPGAILGATLFKYLPEDSLEFILKKVLGSVLILSGVTTWLRIKYYTNTEQPTSMPSLLRTVTIGLLIGFIVSITSIGSGSILLLLLTWYFPIHPRSMVGTDITHAVILTAVSTFVHYSGGQIDFGLVKSVLVGSIPGVLIGAQLIRIFPTRLVRSILAIVIALIGVLLFVK